MKRIIATLSLAAFLTACGDDGNGGDAGDVCAGTRRCAAPVTCRAHSDCGSGYSCFIAQGESVGVCYSPHFECSDTDPCGGTETCICVN